MSWSSELISKAAERLDVLIQDVLTYSKVSKDQQAIVPVDLDELVNDISDSISHLSKLSCQI